jgi:hypothetical protein
MPGPTTTVAPDALALEVPTELFRVDGTVVDLAAPFTGERLAAVVEPSDGSAPRLVVWTEDGGVVDVADGVTAVAWGPASAPPPDDATTTSTTSSSVPEPSTTVPSTTVPSTTTPPSNVASTTIPGTRPAPGEPTAPQPPPPAAPPTTTGP